MATFRQQLAQMEVRTADRFTGQDWRAAKELLLAIIDSLDKRVRIIEDRHIRDIERERIDKDKGR